MENDMERKIYLVFSDNLDAVCKIKGKWHIPEGAVCPDDQRGKRKNLWGKGRYALHPKKPKNSLV